MDRRKQDIEEKRAKLAQLRKSRKERQDKLDEERGVGSTSSNLTGGVLNSSRTSRVEIDNLVSDLLCQSNPPSIVSSTGLISPALNQNSNLNISISTSSSRSNSATLSLGRRSSSQPSQEPQQLISSDGDLSVFNPNSTLDPRDTGCVTGKSPTSVLPNFTDSFQDLYEIQPKPRLLYSKSVQTQPISSTTGVSSQIVQNPDGSTSDPREEELRVKLLREIEAERIQLEKEIKEEKRRLEKEIEEDRLRGLEPGQLASIYTDLEFNEFLESSSKIIQRALSDGYDYLKDYAANLGDEDGMDDREGKRVKRSCEFYDEKLLKNRSVTDLDWSTKNPELSLASYNKNLNGINEPDGIVCIWNLHLLDRPEYVFHSQSDVLSSKFSPFHPNLVIGGTYSGQILIWDIRNRKQLPSLKTPLSASGHTHPVYSISIVGTQNSHNLLSASTDGTICSWVMDMLAQPQDMIEVTNLNHQRTDEMSPTCFSLPTNELNTLWFGTEEGNVYEANRFNRAGMKSGLVQNLVYKGHSGPVLGIDFHPLSGPVDFSDLFLTCGVDWTVKLWRPKDNLTKSDSTGTQESSVVRQPRLSGTASKPVSGIGGNAPNAITPVYSFEEADDYIFDVKWHPAHPAVFGSVDGSGKFNLWNLNSDTEVPTVSTTINPIQPRGLNKLSWEKREGRKVAIGSSDGRVYVYDIGDLALPRESEWDQMRKTLSNILGSSNSISALDVR
ncbi:dynein intermediate chain, cytosolic [Phakopsora pachyrhizi]|uniref:Dynein intermediate chain, cytosolic n=1 Tax=Phakopsora pachyrhizi TaxID=170000 RepID=A0AAV0AXC7_PHAPC|nr:dynein intermediate chain, cytosolic [Phakopsora pachyrhizi]CAH7674965.1 dynein intermediate chain, cytosolic [Phakopsora pachyrhizi]CAH7675089.1 dynein intermediate chain, cytosolic [Phakopsora pachyrhizi]